MRPGSQWRWSNRVSPRGRPLPHVQATQRGRRRACGSCLPAVKHRSMTAIEREAPPPWLACAVIRRRFPVGERPTRRTAPAGSTGGRGLAMPRSLAGANPAQVTASHGPHPARTPCTARSLLPYAFLEGLFQTHSFRSPSIKSSWSNSRFNSRGQNHEQPFIVSHGKFSRRPRMAGVGRTATFAKDKNWTRSFIRRTRIVG